MKNGEFIVENAHQSLLKNDPQLTDGKQIDPLGDVLGKVCCQTGVDKKQEIPEFIRQFQAISNRLSKAETRFYENFNSHEEVLEVYRDLIESNMEVEAKNDQVVEENKALREEINKYKLLIQ